MSARMRLRRADGEIYLDRWGVECRLVGVYLHKMEAPDPGVDLHDHPWPFVSCVLWGGYDEARTRRDLAPMLARAADRGHPYLRCVVRRRRWLTFGSTPLSFCHRITQLHRVPTWTLVVRGRKVRRWGFFLPAGWMDWEEYDNTVRAERRDMWAEISNDNRPKSRYAREGGLRG